MVFSFLLHFPIFPFPIFPIFIFPFFIFPFFRLKPVFSGFPFLSFHIPHIPDIPHIPEIPDIPHIPEIFDLGKFDLGNFLVQTGFNRFFSGWWFLHIFSGWWFLHIMGQSPHPLYYFRLLWIYFCARLKTNKMLLLMFRVRARSGHSIFLVYYS